MSARKLMAIPSIRDIRLLGISGSIRRQSANTAILEALRLRLARTGGVQLTLFDLSALPLFSCDLEGEHLPAPARALQEAIRTYDGLVLSSPEYNAGVSGVLKNALDWASRPSYESPLKDKPCLIMTASMSPGGGVRAAYQVRETLASCLARVVARRDIIVGSVREKLVDGRFTDEATLEFLEGAIGDLVAEIRLLRAHQSPKW